MVFLLIIQATLASSAMRCVLIINMNSYVYANVCIYFYVYIYVYVCIYVYV